ncbi:unannotated protein [freshwater metagenome]|uniref:Unannotated protein n=1 Tax=freshwater metagenome TaxID=449393 RepID=A0A6J6FR59_9ZZZZ
MIVASQTPSVDAIAIGIPSDIPAFQLTTPARAEPMVPEIAAGNMAMRDNAFAVRSLTPNPITSRGTISRPPPTPKSPATKPIAAPDAIKTRTVAVDHSRWLLRSGNWYKTWIAATSKMVMKIHRTVMVFHVRSAHAPRGAVIVDPIAMMRPNAVWSHGTLPENKNEDAATSEVGIIATSEVTDA